MEKFLDKKNIVAIILSLLAITSAATYKYFDNAKENYSNALTSAYQTVEVVKNNLTAGAENLNVQNAEQTNFIQTLKNSAENLSSEVKKMNTVEVPEKFLNDHRKVVESLKTEYSLIGRLEENFSIQNEYEAAEKFAESKDLIKKLKEDTTFLSVDGKDFDKNFELTAVGEKIEKYLNTKKQLRYDRDQKEQAEREKAAAAEKAKQEAAKRQAEMLRREEERRNYPLGRNWIQDKSTGIFMQNPKPVDGETISWSGDFVWNGGYKFANGYGTTTWIRYGKVVQVDRGRFIQGRRDGEFQQEFYPSGRTDYTYWSNGVEFKR